VNDIIQRLAGDERLGRQLQFVLEIDQLKSVFRRSYLLTGDRNENSAEHSWHIAMLAIVLAEYANEQVEVGRVIKLAVVHDIVEIDADDTFCYDEAALLTKVEREQRAAERIFGLLPDDQRDDIRALWDEYDAMSTPESRFANALDRIMPILHNFCTNGRSWREHSVTRTQVLTRNAHTADGSERLWEFIRQLVDEAVERGYLAPE
jgi:putative hydrolase of HD superfamily